MTQLQTPTITLEVIDKTTVRVSGLSVDHARGYQVKVGTLSGGQTAQTVTPVDGVVEFANRSPRTMYFVSARALGDDDDYSNSAWSDEQTVQTGTNIDQSLDVPNIGAATESFTTLAISGLSAYKEYRVQVATSAEGLDTTPPRVIGTSDGSAKLMGLEPGTLYYIRCCLAEGARCSLWSDVVTARTSDVTNTIEVTSGNDTGTGTLRAAITNSTDGTKIILNVAAVTINTLISSTKRLYIIGGLDERTVIQAGNNNGLFTGAYLDFRHVKFTGALGNNRVLNSAARLDDCVLNGIQSTSGSGYISNVIVYNSRVENNYANQYGLNTCLAYDTVIADNAARSGLGGGANGGTYSNCVITGNTASSSGGGANGGTFLNCVITGNTGANGGGANGGTFLNCVITGNTASNSGGGGYGGTYSNCVITANTAGSSGSGVYGGQQAFIDTCLLVDNKRANNTADDFTLITNTSCTIRNATIGAIVHNKPTYLQIYNTLYQVWSESPTAGNAGNLCYSDYEDDYFIDAANSDYRLKPGSPAINAGDNQYVQATSDLAGNPRIGGATVDVGAYEFQPTPLPAPVLEVEDGTDQATIHFTLPSGASAFRLEYANHVDFSGATVITATEAGIVLPGLDGAVFFRAKYIGISGLADDSAWSNVVSKYYDHTAPTVVVTTDPVEYEVGSLVNLLVGLDVTDDSGAVITAHYSVLDQTGVPITVDGQTIDVDTRKIATGHYTILYSATDPAGNVGTAERPLTVTPKALTAPTLSIRTVALTSVVLGGFEDVNASGWQISIDGIEKKVSPNAAGQVTITGLTGDATHAFRAKALGDWIAEQYSGSWRDSVWSDTVQVTLSPSGGQTGNLIEDRLTSVRTRIAIIRSILADPSSLTDVTIDGISEKVNRQALSEELRMLERQEVQLLYGTSGSRFHNVDTSRA